MQYAQNALKDAVLFPFWLDDGPAPATELELIGRAQADLLVVGGGFTGLWAALQAKEADPEREVVLIEASKVAHGASGRPGAIVSTSLMHGLQNAIRHFPNDIEVLERLGQENMRGFLATLARHGIDAHQHWGGELTVAIGTERLSGLAEEYGLHQRYGHEVELLDEHQTRQQLNSPLFSGAVWNKKLSGTLHPARLAWGLKSAAIALGVKLHEHTPMKSIEDRGSHLLVKTPHGEIKTPKVLLATNAFASGHRHIQRRVVAIRDRVLATEPLSAEQLRRIGWSNRQGVYDTRTQLNYMRLTKDNRIIFGGRLAYYYGGDPDPEGDRRLLPYFGLANAFNATFPQLADVRFSHAWSGLIDMTTRMAVHFQSYYGGKAVWAGGYSGFGVSTSRFGARIGLAKLDRLNIPELQLDFAKTMPNWIPPEPFRWIGAKITLYALDTADQKGGWRHAWLRLVHALGFPL